MGPIHLAFATFIFMVVISTICASSKLCPNPSEIAPCTCDAEGVNCWHAKDLDTISRVFQVPFPAGGVRGVWIQDGPISRLPKNIFSKLMVQTFNLDNNQIEVVESGAFNGSQNTVQTIIVYNNKVRDFPFSDLRSLRLLEVLNLGKNELTSIPDDAFGPHPSLNKLIFTYNKISHIGKRAFSGLPNLQAIELSFNSLKTLGPLSLAMNGHLSSLELHFNNNSISSIDSNALEGSIPMVLSLGNNKLTKLDEEVFLPVVSGMSRNAKGIISVNGNPFSCTGCEYEWLIINQRIVQYFLRGFQCPSGAGLLDIDETSIGCN